MVVCAESSAVQRNDLAQRQWRSEAPHCETFVGQGAVRAHEIDIQKTLREANIAGTLTHAVNKREMSDAMSKMGYQSDVRLIGHFGP